MVRGADAVVATPAQIAPRTSGSQGLALTDPVPQSLRVDTQVPRDMRDRTSAGPNLPNRTFAQLIGVLTWYWNCSWFS